MSRLQFLVLLATIIAVPVLSHPDTRESSENTGLRPYRIRLVWWPGYCYEHRSDTSCNATSTRQFVLGSLLPLVKGVPSAPCEMMGDEPRLFYPTLDITYFMPDKDMAAREWSAYGACSGRPIPAFFRRVILEFKRVHVPDQFLDPASNIVLTPTQLKEEFLAANPNFDIRSVRVACNHGLLTGVDLFIGGDDRSSEPDCKEPSVTAVAQMPPVE